MNALLGIVSGEFWSFNAMQVLMLISMLGAFVVWFSKFEGRTRTTTEALAAVCADTKKTFQQQSKAFDEIVARVTQMDREGSRKSQQELLTSQKLQEVTDRRLDRMETVVLELAPEVAAITANLAWINAFVKKGISNEG